MPARVGDDQLETPRRLRRASSRRSASQDFCVGGINVRAENFAPTVAVDANRNNHRGRDDTALLAHLQISGVDLQSLSIGWERPHAVVDLGTQPAPLAFRDRAHRHRPHQIVHPASGEALQAGFLHDRSDRSRPRDEARENSETMSPSAMGVRNSTVPAWFPSRDHDSGFAAEYARGASRHASPRSVPRPRAPSFAGQQSRPFRAEDRCRDTSRSLRKSIISLVKRSPPLGDGSASKSAKVAAVFLRTLANYRGLWASTLGYVFVRKTRWH